MTANLLKHLRVLEPHPGILAFYDGRVEGHRFAPEPNWVDDGALSVGIASYVVVEGDEALVYDPHVSVEHGRFIRDHLSSLGVKHVKVVLSHWHLDHIAGTAAFPGCPVIANRKTFDHMRKHQQAIETGSHHGMPPIKPLVLPDHLFEGRMKLQLGKTTVELIEANIHSDDGTVLWLPERGILLAGDTMEDTVTFVCEPEHFDTHLAELDRMAALDPLFILPNHGDPDIIASGGYDKGFIKAQQQYIRILKRCRDDESLRAQPLARLIEGPLQRGWVNLYGPYEDVHAANLALVLKTRPSN
jgi:cyclase